MPTSNEQYEAIIQRLDRIIELLEGQTKPKQTTERIVDRSMADHYRITSHNTLIDADNLGRQWSISHPNEGMTHCHHGNVLNHCTLCDKENNEPPIHYGTTNEDGVIRPTTIADIQAAQSQGYGAMVEWQSRRSTHTHEHPAI